jgi:hypothetical protein
MAIQKKGASHCETGRTRYLADISFRRQDKNSTLAFYMASGYTYEQAVSFIRQADEIDKASKRRKPKK